MTEGHMSDPTEVYLVTVTAVYDQGCGGIFTDLNPAIEHCRAQWAISDGHHAFRIDKVRLDEPIDNSGLLKASWRDLATSDADDHIWITEDTDGHERRTP